AKILLWISASSLLRSRPLFVYFAQSFGGSYVVQSLADLFGRKRRTDLCSEMRRPVGSDFHTVVAKTGLSVTFKPNEQHLQLCDRQSRHCAPWPRLVHGSPTRETQY